MSRIALLFLLIAAPVLALALATLGLETLWQNLLGWVLFLAGVAYCAGIVIYYWIRKIEFWEIRGDALAEEQGDRSFWLILPGMLVTFFAPPLEYLYLNATLPRTWWMQLAGLLFVFLGVALRLRHPRQVFRSCEGCERANSGDDWSICGHPPPRICRFLAALAGNLHWVCQPHWAGGHPAPAAARAGLSNLGRGSLAVRGIW